MKNKRLALAWIKCWWFCLLNTHRGYCMYSETRRAACGRPAKTSCVAAVTGSAVKGTLKIHRVFYGRPIAVDTLYDVADVCF